MVDNQELRHDTTNNNKDKDERRKYKESSPSWFWGIEDW